MAVLAYPTDLAGWISHDQRISRNILRYHRPGTDHGIPPDRMSTNNRSVSSDRGPLANHRLLILVFPRDSATRIGYICKHATRPQEHIILANHPRINRHIVLYLHVIP